MLKLNVLIAGSTGYMGIQLIKLLSKHKNINNNNNNLKSFFIRMHPNYHYIFSIKKTDEQF